MVSATREIICLTLVSRPGVPSLPRKYLLTTTFVAICDQNVGISQSFCSKTVSPFSLPIAAVRGFPRDLVEGMHALVGEAPLDVDAAALNLHLGAHAGLFRPTSAA